MTQKTLTTTLIQNNIQAVRYSPVTLQRQKRFLKSMYKEEPKSQIAVLLHLFAILETNILQDIAVDGVLSDYLKLIQTNYQNVIHILNLVDEFELLGDRKILLKICRIYNGLSIFDDGILPKLMRVTEMNTQLHAYVVFQEKLEKLIEQMEFLKEFSISYVSPYDVESASESILFHKDVTMGRYSIVNDGPITTVYTDYGQFLSTFKSASKMHLEHGNGHGLFELTLLNKLRNNII